MENVSHKTGHMTSHNVSPSTNHSPDPGPNTFQRIEVITGVGRRRQWTLEQKSRIVAESLAPGASVLAVCRCYGLNSNQLYAWRRKFRVDEVPTDGRPALGFTPLVLGDSAPSVATKPGMIEVAVGRMVVRLDGPVDSAALHQVLDVVRRLG